MTATIQEMLMNLQQWYAIRLSSFDKLSLETTQKLFDDYAYIISEEGDGITTKYHQHIILVYDGTTEQVREMIKGTYSECVGNKCLYIKACKDKKQLAKYTLKEGKYVYKGFDPKFIEDTFKCSKQKTDLKKEITDNEDDLVLGRITELQFVERYVLIKVRHDQPLYTNHIRAYVLKMLIKADKMSSKSYAISILDSFQ